MVRFHQHRSNNCNNLISSAILASLCPDTGTACPTIYQPSESSTQWPTLAEMLRRGQRYVVISEDSTEASYSYLLSDEVRKQESLKYENKLIHDKLFTFLVYLREQWLFIQSATGKRAVYIPTELSFSSLKVSLSLVSDEAARQKVRRKNPISAVYIVRSANHRFADGLFGLGSLQLRLRTFGHFFMFPSSTMWSFAGFCH